MTKAEIEQKAEERLNALKEQIKRFNFQFVLDVIEELEEENKELKAQIEKMKNMQNCKHNWETKGQCVLNNGGNCICNKWELAKND